MIDELIEKIVSGPYFLKLKSVVENGPYHDHERTFDHLIKTKDIAQRELEAGFITNPQAKEKFLEFVKEDFNGYKRADLMVLAALLHDVGKLLSVKEEGKLRSIVVNTPEGDTIIPGHEYWGSTIIFKFLENLSLPKEIVNYISEIVGMHGEFQGEYLPSKKEWSMDKLINDIKSRAKGFYIESLFNHYCDVYTAAPFQEMKPTVLGIFNQPSLYLKREYIIE